MLCAVLPDSRKGIHQGKRRLCMTDMHDTDTVAVLSLSNVFVVGSVPDEPNKHPGFIRRRLIRFKRSGTRKRACTDACMRIDKIFYMLEYYSRNFQALLIGERLRESLSPSSHILLYDLWVRSIICNEYTMRWIM